MFRGGGGGGSSVLQGTDHYDDFSTVQIGFGLVRWLSGWRDDWFILGIVNPLYAMLLVTSLGGGIGRGRLVRNIRMGCKTGCATRFIVK